MPILSPGETETIFIPPISLKYLLAGPFPEKCCQPLFQSKTKVIVFFHTLAVVLDKSTSVLAIGTGVGPESFPLVLGTLNSCPVTDFIHVSDFNHF